MSFEISISTFKLLDNVDAELQKWKNISKNSQEMEERRRANTFIRAIEPIVEEIKALESFRLREMEDSANSILGCIDDLWKLEDYKYPQDQMDHLLNISSTTQFTGEKRNCYLIEICYCRCVFRRSDRQETQKQFNLDAKFYKSYSLGSSMLHFKCFSELRNC